MKFSLNQLSSFKQQPLPPHIIINSAEPLLMIETEQFLQNIANKQGFTDKQRLDYSTGFNWSLLAKTTQGYSLFAEKTLIFFNATLAKVDKQWVQTLLDNTLPTDDTVIITTLPPLTKAQIKTQWYQHLVDRVAVVEINAISNTEFPQWLKRRCQRAQLTLQPQAAAELLALVNGNCLAAKQAIERLQVMFADQTLSADKVTSALGDDSRYDIFQLMNEVLQRQTVKAKAILLRLQALNTEPNLLIWVLEKELRLLYQLKRANCTEQQQIAKQNQLWPARKKLLLQHCQQFSSEQYRLLLIAVAACEQRVKGFKMGDSWRQLTHIIDVLLTGEQRCLSTILAS